MDLFVGIDVGTGSARAGLFTSDGSLVASATQAISIWSDGAFVEQSSSEIWTAICKALRTALGDAGASAADVKGIGFDATCSLVIIGENARPLPTRPGGEPERNVVVWMDHRATEQAERINRTGHSVLSYVGGRISPEMQVPKLLWLKENNPATFGAAKYFFDLSDYLTYRATGSLARSLCTVVCKWTYLGHESRWDASFFREIGLAELADDDFFRIGSTIADIATPIGNGLTDRAARELGLLAGTPVGAALIDAHAGGVGTMGGRSRPGEEFGPTGRLALIMGTSACAMAVTREPVFVDGVWGPYYSAMLPGFWLNEGGQSAFGAALDHLVSMHPASVEARRRAQEKGVSLPEYLEAQALRKAGSVEATAWLARDVHVLPEFLGNRSPEADPARTAAITGLRLDTSLDSLVALYVAGLCGLAYGTADILDALTEKGLPLRTLVVSGGAARSALFRRILADGTGFDVALPASPEPVLLGAAILGASSAQDAPLWETACRMSAIVETIAPQSGRVMQLHAVKRGIYRQLKSVESAARGLTATLCPHD